VKTGTIEGVRAAGAVFEFRTTSVVAIFQPVIATVQGVVRPGA
jgi:hypothetical protein